MGNIDQVICDILNLVLKLNSTKERKYFFEFSGHVNWVEVRRKLKNYDSEYIDLDTREWSSEHCSRYFYANNDSLEKALVVKEFLSNELNAEEDLNEGSQTISISMPVSKAAELNLI